MLRAARTLSVPAALSLAVLTLAACGGSSSGGDSREVVARVAATSITRAAVNHWMTTLAGGDYYELSGRHMVPAGLVSDPPDYTRCVDRLGAAAAQSPKAVRRLTGLEALTKCRELYQALKYQAVSYLVEAEWLIGLSDELGATASDGEVVKLFKKIKAEQFPTEAEQRQFLAIRRISLADELFVVKLDVLKGKDAEKLHAKGQQAFKELTEAGRRWTAKTSCRAGYVVQHCKQYVEGPAALPSPSPAVLMEQVAAIATGRCTNFAACRNQ